MADPASPPRVMQGDGAGAAVPSPGLNLSFDDEPNGEDVQAVGRGHERPYELKLSTAGDTKCGEDDVERILLEVFDEEYVQRVQKQKYKTSEGLMIFYGCSANHAVNCE